MLLTPHVSIPKCGVGLKNGSYCANRLALVVVDFRAGADPTRIGDRRGRIVGIERARLGLKLELRFASESVGIDETQLHPASFAGREIADMRFARDRGGADRDPVEVVEDSRRRRAEMVGGGRVGVIRVEERLNLRRREIGDEAFEGVALDRAGGLAEQRRARKHSQCVETGFGAIAVRVGHLVWLEHAVVELRGCLVAHGVAGTDERQIVFLVVGDDRRVAEGVAEAVRQKEMRVRVGELPRRRIVRIRRIEDPTGRNPEVTVAVEVAIFRGGRGSTASLPAWSWRERCRAVRASTRACSSRRAGPSTRCGRAAASLPGCCFGTRALALDQALLDPPGGRRGIVGDRCADPARTSTASNASGLAPLNAGAVSS